MLAMLWGDVTVFKLELETEHKDKHIWHTFDLLAKCKLKKVKEKKRVEDIPLAIQQPGNFHPTGPVQCVGLAE